LAVHVEIAPASAAAAVPDTHDVPEGAKGVAMFPADEAGAGTSARAIAAAAEAAEAAKVRCEQNAKAIERVAKAIEAAQDDLASVAGAISAGEHDFRTDAAKLLRDANRDLRKLALATERDLEHLRKDLAAGAQRQGEEDGASAEATAASRAGKSSTR
jgi:hypothetical protein